MSVSSLWATGFILANACRSFLLKVVNFSMTVAGATLVNDCNLELTLGTRYGLIGNNGCGKTAMLNAIARREVELPTHLDIYHLHEEAPPTDRTAVQSVVDHVREELERLEKLEEAIIEESGADDDRLELVTQRISELDPETFEVPLLASPAPTNIYPSTTRLLSSPPLRSKREGYTTQMASSAGIATCFKPATQN
jgi:hypothetical protein